MITGTYNRTLDNKGRLMIPREMQDAMGEQVTMIRLPDCALALLAGDRRAEITGAPLGPAMQRYFLSGSHLGIVHPVNGRVLLPIEHRMHAGITPGCEIAVVGCGNFIMIVRRERWDAALEALTERVVDLAFSRRPRKAKAEATACARPTQRRRTKRAPMGG